MAVLNPRAPPGTPGGSAKAHTSQEIHDMLDRAVRLVAENKITKDNAWDLNIINYMPSLVETLAQEDHFNFQKTSVALHASAQVYSKRVDSAYDEAYASISGIKVKNGAPGEVNETFEHDPMFYRLTKLFDESSAAGLMMLNVPAYYQEQLMLSAAETPMSAFPTSMPPATPPEPKLVCVKGLQRLGELLHVHRDADITPSILGLHSKAEPEACSLSMDDEDIMRSVLGMQSHGRDPCPAKQSASEERQGWDGSNMGGFPEGCAPASAEDIPSMDAALEDVGMDDVWQDAGGDGARDDEDPPPLSFGMAEDDAPGADDMGCGGDDLAPEPDQAGEGSDDEASQVHSCVSQMASYLDVGGQQQQQRSKQAARSTAWAGASFWKFRSKAPSVDPGAEKPAPRGRAKSKAAFRFQSRHTPDYEQMVILDKEDVGQLRLKRATHTVTLLPPDMHFKESQLFSLPGIPHKTVLDIWSSHQAADRACRHTKNRASIPMHPGTPCAGDGEQHDGVDGGCDEGGDIGGGFENDDFATFEGSEGMGAGLGSGGAPAEQVWDFEHQSYQQLMDQLLLPAPRKVAKVDLNYDKAAKQVDVRALKEMLGHNINSLRAKGQQQQQQQQQQQEGQHQEQPKGSHFTFQEVIAQLPQNALGDNGEVSVHICFVCLLHLANENSLALSNGGSLDSLGISCY
ncbi:condensin complex subunit 2/barren [Dunaliella salina]|uniref:Condensin complex subunit 2 n=1 Tax=Dunaliella salina TaxID=3046 RepID=A0ABQ7GU66_DUNSA|nr:condensin complex subunit 2/barren [Dunaliella salina]|eukprot:KAF5838152.1 condensin complex subunit 2/barren [Dunaliella salina]